MHYTVLEEIALNIKKINVTKDIGNKLPIYKLKAGKEVEDYYDEWTKENKYDKDMVDWKYSGPEETIDLFKKYNSKKILKY